MNVARAWPSNGQLAVTGDRWIMACGNVEYTAHAADNRCEILDTQAPTIKWTLIDNMPNSVCTTRMSTIGIHQNWIIMSGGYNKFVFMSRRILFCILSTNKDSRCATTHAYNALTREWRQLANISPRSSAAMTVINGNEVVICGGYNGTQSISTCQRIIDPINNRTAQWLNDIPNLPIAIYAHSLLYANNALMVLGGCSAASWSPVCVSSVPCLQTFFCSGPPYIRGVLATQIGQLKSRFRMQSHNLVVL